MKKILFCAAFGLLLMSCRRGEPVRLTADVENAVVTKVVYAPVSLEFPHGEVTEAQADADGGYRIPDDGTALFLKVSFLRTDSVRTSHPLLLMPGERLHLSGRAANTRGVSELKISGSELYDKMEQELLQVQDRTERFGELARRYRDGDKLTPEETAELDSLNRWAMAYMMNRICKEPASPTSALYLFSCTNEMPEIYETLYAKFPEEVLNGKYKALFDAATPEKVRAWKAR